MAKEYIAFGELTKETGLSESTARRYIDTFKGYVPSRKFNKYTKYEREAVGVLLVIAKGYEDKKTVAEIKAELDTRFNQVIDVEDETQAAAVPLPQAAIRPVYSDEALAVIMQQGQAIIDVLDRLAVTMEKINSQSERIAYLEAVIQELKENTTTTPPGHQEAQEVKKKWKFWGRK
jgi:DNA-binding transcriptional MerR regulator